MNSSSPGLAVSFTTVCVLSRWNQCDLVYVLFIQYLHIRARQTAYHLSLRCVLVSKRIRETCSLMQVSCTRFKDENTDWFCEKKQANGWFLTRANTTDNTLFVNTLFASKREKKRCQRVARSSIDLWKMPSTSHDLSVHGSWRRPWRVIKIQEFHEVSGIELGARFCPRGMNHGRDLKRKIPEAETGWRDATLSTPKFPFAPWTST